MLEEKNKTENEIIVLTHNNLMEKAKIRTGVNIGFIQHLFIDVHQTNLNLTKILRLTKKVVLCKKIAKEVEKLEFVSTFQIYVGSKVRRNRSISFSYLEIISQTIRT